MKKVYVSPTIKEYEISGANVLCGSLARRIPANGSFWNKED